MPTYEYECQECKGRFDLFQSMSAEPVKICPRCGGPVERLISAGAGVIFKGSGFHAAGHARERPSCGLETPCCGRDRVCERKPCGS